MTLGRHSATKPSDAKRHREPEGRGDLGLLRRGACPKQWAPRNDTACQIAAAGFASLAMTGRARDDTTLDTLLALDTSYFPDVQ